MGREDERESELMRRRGRQPKEGTGRVVEGKENEDEEEKVAEEEVAEERECEGPENEFRF